MLRAASAHRLCDADALEHTMGEAVNAAAVKFGASDWGQLRQLQAKCGDTLRRLARSPFVNALLFSRNASNALGIEIGATAMDFARRLLCASATGTLDRILLALGFLIFAAPQGLAAQSDDWRNDLGIRWSASSIVPPLTISGIVINVVTGEPVARAQVYLEDVRIGAVTDAEGRFDFEAPGPGEFVLSAMSLAHDLVSDTIRLGERSGLLIQIGLVWEHMTPEELRRPQERLSLPCGAAVVSDATSDLEFHLRRGGSVSRFPGFDSASTVGVTRDPSLCRDILAPLPDDLQRELLAGTWEFQIEQFGETFVVVLCPWPIPRIMLDDACSAYPVRREADDFSFENVVLMYW